MKKILFVIIAILISGCTQQMRAKEWGGTVDDNLPPGQKLVNVTWENQNLWYLTRSMKPTDKVETYTMIESSSFGIFQGKIIIHEHTQ